MFASRFRMNVSTAAGRHRSACQAVSKNSARIVVVGDIHNQWSERDAVALQGLQPDFTLFVGDFGNENVALVRQIASLDIPKAAILGNHDAWYTMTARPRSRSRSPSSSSHQNGSSTQQQQQQQLQPDEQADTRDRVQQQLDAFGDCHVGYGHMPLPGGSISLVGARPFTKGGKSLRTIREFMARLYGVVDMGDSAAKIMEVINTQVPPDNALILMGHNGPAGLGDSRFNICGVDWVAEAGDHGDPDLQAVLQQLQAAGRAVSLVVFGHMHHTLKGSGKRQMVHVDGSTGCVYLNAATVPRVTQDGHRYPGASRHHFLMLDMLEGQVHCAADVWVQVSAAADADDTSAQHSTAASNTQQQQNGNGNGNGYSSSSCSSSVDGRLVSQAAKQGSNGADAGQPQLLLDHQQKVVGSFNVQVVEVHEVLRTASVGSNGDSRVAKHYWDAHKGQWVKVLLEQSAAVVAANVVQ